MPEQITIIIWKKLQLEIDFYPHMFALGIALLLGNTSYGNYGYGFTLSIGFFEVRFGWGILPFAEEDGNEAD